MCIRDSPDVFAKNAQILGKAQEEWLAKNLAQGGATWNAIAQQVTMMSLDRRRKADEPEKIVNLDSWAGSVSYTHLDVYKRQMGHGSAAPGEPMRHSMRDMKRAPTVKDTPAVQSISPMPVPYTHLDVYKRKARRG